MRRSRRLRKLGLVLAAAVVLLAAAGSIYQAVGVRLDAEKYVPVGQFYNIDHKRMHLYSGGDGDTTVVFAAGWGTVNPVVDFYPLYEPVARHARFVVYDKFGYGYSDLTNEDRDIDRIVDEIHQALAEAAGEGEPSYIFVGHSLASLEVIRYAQRYPGEVQAVVLIDGGNPEFYAKTKPVTFISRFQRLLINLGVARVLYHIDGFADFINSERNGLRLLPDNLKKIDERAVLLKANNASITDEMKRSRENAQKVVEGGKLDSLPLVVITAGDFNNAGKDWLDSQQELLNWSQASKQVMVQDAGHYIHHYHPEIVANEIIALINGNEQPR